jgi:hypothetical protein
VSGHIGYMGSILKSDIPVKTLVMSNKTNPSHVWWLHAYSPSYSGGWARKPTRAQEFEINLDSIVKTTS